VRRPLRAVLASCLAAGTLVVAGAAPAHAVDQECSAIRADNVDPTTAERTGSPVQLMQIAEAQRIVRESGKEPGEGVVVAVLDSGVVKGELMLVGRGPRFSQSDEEEPLEMQGTAVAGLIAGKGEEDQPIGIAPGAAIYDIRIYDRLAPDPATESAPDAAALLEGLRHVAELPRGTVDVVNVSVAVRQSTELADELDAVLEDLARKDVVVVAATGDRPEEADPLYAEFGYDGEEPPHGEDARGVIWPANGPHVVGVNASATVLVEDEVVPGDAADTVLRNAATDVAAPTADAVSVGLDGDSTCLLPDVSTAWAAAEVSGIVALLRSYFPRESAPQIVQRLLRTATGSPRAGTTLTGHGVVQPVEALERPLPGKDDGGTRIVDQGNERAEAPQPEPDVLASTRRNAVWWGLLAGGALVVAVLLRPVLARRRDS
jgi:membrane-anchored mycosin MYCP